MRSDIERIVQERRTIKTFTDEPLTKDVLLKLLNDAVWAPFHSKVEPWRFIIFMDEGRKRFSDAVLSTYTPEELQRFGERVTIEYCEQTPVHVVVVIREEMEIWKREDDLMATATLIQNLQLLAWEQRIGFVWKSNEYNREEDFKEAIGIQAGEKIVGTLHMGYFSTENIPKARPRTAAEQLITWHES